MARRSPVQSVHVFPNRPASEPPVTSPSEEPAWKQRAVERSIKTAKLRAAQRVQRFLDAAQAIIIEKGSTDFTVQEVVDRSRQSLRSFDLQFDGKHELFTGIDYTDANVRLVGMNVLIGLLAMSAIVLAINAAAWGARVWSERQAG